MIRYCILDIIGTVFPWKESFRFHYLFSRLNLKPRLSEAELRRLLRERIESLFVEGKEGLRRLVEEAYVTDSVEDATSAVALFDEVLLAEAEIHPKAEDILNRLSLDYTLIVSSDTTGTTRKMVERSGIARYFAKEFYSDELHMTKSKEFYGHILESFPGSSPPEFVSVGDGLRSDIAYPKRLGMKTIWVKNEALGTYDVEPDYVIEDFAQVVDAVRILASSNHDRKV